MKQILIEKYIKPSEIIKDGSYTIKHWLNRDYDLHSFIGQPAYAIYYNGKIIKQIWYKKGIIYRNKDLPVRIEYNIKGQMNYQSWYKKGVIHRDGDLPAAIGYCNGRLVYKAWYKNGEQIKQNFNQ